MEESDFSLLILCEIIDIMLPLFIIEFHFVDDLLQFEFLPDAKIIELLRVFYKVGFYGWERLNNVVFPVKISTILIPSGSLGHLKRSLVKLEELSLVGLVIKNELVKLGSDVFQSGLFVHLP